MGWQVYEDMKGRPLRWAGYGVPAYCDHPGCKEEIDRGILHHCGEINRNEEDGCGLHFLGGFEMHEEKSLEILTMPKFSIGQPVYDKTYLLPLIVIGYKLTTRGTYHYELMDIERNVTNVSEVFFKTV